MRPIPMLTFAGAVLVPLCAVALATAAQAQAEGRPTGLEDMVDARAGQAEGELQRRGWRNTGGQQGDDRSYTNWWNADRQQCVTIATMDGRYASITATPAPDCGQQMRREASRDNSRYRPAPSGAPINSGDLARTCRGEAAMRFDRRPGELTVNAPIQRPNGATVQGWFDNDDTGRSTFFTCRFDGDGRFVSVN